MNLVGNKFNQIFIYSPWGVFIVLAISIGLLVGCIVALGIIFYYR